VAIAGSEFRGQMGRKGGQAGREEELKRQGNWEGALMAQWGSEWTGRRRKAVAGKKSGFPTALSLVQGRKLWLACAADDFFLKCLL